MKPIHFFFALGLLVSLGCGKPQVGEASRSPASQKSTSNEQFKRGDGSVHFVKPQDDQMAGMLNEKAPAMAEEGQPPAQKPLAVEPPPRKIVRTADVKIIVNDFEQAEKDLRRLIEELKEAYVAQAVITGSAGSPRHGLWKVRIPVNQLDAFLDAVSKLGVPEKNSIDSKDVTEEYYDLEARIKNKKVEEERLLKHLEKSTGKLEEILAVEREISRVRGEIEQHEGRLRLLANLTALTTVTITIQEIKNYVPPQTPTFTSNISSTFSGSFELLVGLGKSLVLIAVGLAPWLPVIAVLGVPTWFLLRRSTRRVPTPSQPAS